MWAVGSSSSLTCHPNRWLPMNKSTSRVTGKQLNELWNVHAAHALYREDGTWYHHLAAFPGALFDRNGYVVFRSREEYERSPYLRHAQDLHVPTGIAAMPNYVRVR